MNKILFLTAIALSVCTYACKNVDEKLVQQMEQTVATAQTNSEVPMKSAEQSVTAVKAKLDEIGKQPGNEAAYYMGQKIQDKYNLAVEQFNAAQAKIKKLQDDYSAGSVDKETAEKQLAELTQELQSYQRSFEKMNAIANRPTDELVTMGKEILKSEGKTPSAPAPAFTDAGGGNGAPMPSGGAGTDAANPAPAANAPVPAAMPAPVVKGKSTARAATDAAPAPNPAVNDPNGPSLNSLPNGAKKKQ